VSSKVLMISGGRPASLDMLRAMRHPDDGKACRGGASKATWLPSGEKR
jgi:hypothetical protein